MSTIPKYCTVSSNACLSIYPNNTLTKFTNTMPYPIYPKKGRRIYIRLRALAISHELVTNNPYAYYIKVLISEMEPQASNAIYIKSICEVKFPPGRIYGHYALHEYEDEPFLPLQSIPLYKLSILICDSANTQLQLKAGPSTFIKFELTDMEAEGQFTQTCFSHMPNELQFFPNNTYNDFRVKLPGSILLNDYEVALANIILPSDLQNKNPPLNLTIKYVDARGDGDPIETTWDFEFNADDYTNTTAFLDDVRSTIQDEENLSTKFALTFYQEEGSEDNNKLAFEVRNINEGEFFNVAISAHFAYVIRRKDPIRRGLVYRTNGVYIIGGKAEEININFGKASKIALLYCNFIEQNIVASNMYALLHIFPLEVTNGIYEPEHYIFHPVKEQNFTNFKFFLRQPDGSKHDLESYTVGGIGIRLLFRPRVSPLRNMIIMKNNSGERGGGSDAREVFFRRRSPDNNTCSVLGVCE